MTRRTTSAVTSTTITLIQAISRTWERRIERFSCSTSLRSESSNSSATGSSSGGSCKNLVRMGAATGRERLGDADVFQGSGRENLGVLINGVAINEDQRGAISTV